MANGQFLEFDDGLSPPFKWDGAHGLGSGQHEADTLANLNSKISDADVPRAVGFVTITVSATAPGNPAVGDLWVDTS